MAPSRRKGVSKAAAAAAARRQWKIGDLVLAKVKGFPAWPATVSDAEKWGYSTDWKKVVVHFFGTEQIAFCNPADVEAFTEEKKESLLGLLGKRHGRGADFIRAVHEIADIYEKLKEQEHVSNASCNDEVTEAKTEVLITEPDDKNIVDSFNKSGSKKEASSPSLGISLKTADSAGDDGDFNSLAEAAVSELEKKGLHGEEVPASEPNSNVVVTYCSRRKLENLRIQDSLLQSRVQSARRSRSSRVDTRRLQSFILARSDDHSVGDISAISRDITGRRSKRLRKSPHGMDSPALDSNGNIGENEPCTGTVSDTVGSSDGITLKSACKPLQPKSAVEHCEPEVELNQSLEFQNNPFIFKKKRKPNRKRPSNGTIETIAGLDKVVASEVDTPKRKYTLLIDHENLDERYVKEDGDEHLPLVKRARVRMGASPHHPVSAGEQNDIQVAEKMSELSNSVSRQNSLSFNHEENDSANGNLLVDKADQNHSSTLNIISVKQPQPWEARKNQPFGRLLEGEAALPPSKRLHRALEAMSANAAEDSQTSSDGPAAMNVSINGYCFSSGECFKVSGESGEGVEVGCSDVESLRKISFNADPLYSDPSIEEETEKHFEEVAARSRRLNCDDYTSHESCGDANEALGSGDCKHICASSLTNHIADVKESKQDLEILPHLEEGRASLDCLHGSPGIILHSRNDSEPSNSKLSKPSMDPEQNSVRALDPTVGEENSSNSLQNFTNSNLACPENNCTGSVELSQLSLHEEKRNNAMDDLVKENGSAIKSPTASISPAPAMVTITMHQDQRMSHSNSITDDHSGDKAISATQSSSSVTDGLDSGPRTSPLDTSMHNLSVSNNKSKPVEKNGSCGLEAQLHVDKPNHAAKFSSIAGNSVALSSFEAILGTLTRSKESIVRATHIAIDCAKMGVAAKVVEILTRNLETESSLHRRVDLFFLVDSITQCSRGMKGSLSGIYPSAIQEVLPRLLSAAAPPGSGSQENRRQCLKVLRVWQERRIFPESIIRHHIRELHALCCSSSSGAFSRSLKTERSFDDPIREMEGMMVDEYGSNSSIQFPGFCMPPMLRDRDGGSDSDEENFEAVTPEHDAENSEGLRTSIPAIEKHRHILEDVDGELEMEDVAPSCDADATLISGSVDTLHSKYNQFEQFVHYAPKAMPPPSVSPQPPPHPPPLPPPPRQSTFTPSAIPDSASNCFNSKLYLSSENVKDEAQDIAQHSVASRDNSVHHGPYRRKFHAHVAMQMPDAPNSSYRSQPAAHPSLPPMNNIQAADGTPHKGFHLRPPHPAPTDQFSYVQADQRMQSRRDNVPSSNSNRHHMDQNRENGNFYRNRGRMKPAHRDLGESWRSSAPPFSDIPRRPYGPAPFAPPREPPLPSHRWAYPPRANRNHREFLPHRPSAGGPIPVASRGPNFWRPR